MTELFRLVNCYPDPCYLDFFGNVQGAFPPRRTWWIFIGTGAVRWQWAARGTLFGGRRPSKKWI